MKRFPAAVLFDFDGVLVNSEPLHFYSFHEVLLKEKIQISEQDYYQEMLGLADRDGFKLVYQKQHRELDPGTLLRVMTRKSETMMELIYRRQFKALPGVEEFVRGLWRSYPLGICSGARREEIEAMLTGIALRDCFKVIVSADDCAIGKPNPAGYLMAMQELARKSEGVFKPADCLVIEDSPAVVRSARKAGFKVLALSNSVPAARLADADWIADSLMPQTIHKLIPHLKLGA